MQNLFTIEHQARIVAENYRADARHHDLIKLARAGQPRRSPGGTLMAAIDSARERLASITRREVATTRPVCQPGMAC